MGELWVPDKPLVFYIMIALLKGQIFQGAECLQLEVQVLAAPVEKQTLHPTPEIDLVTLRLFYR